MSCRLAGSSYLLHSFLLHHNFIRALFHPNYFSSPLVKMCPVVLAGTLFASPKFSRTLGDVLNYHDQSVFCSEPCGHWSRPSALGCSAFKNLGSGIDILTDIAFATHEIAGIAVGVKKIAQIAPQPTLCLCTSQLL